MLLSSYRSFYFKSYQENSFFWEKTTKKFKTRIF